MICSKSRKFWPNRWFSCFFTKWGTFCNFLLKSSSKGRNVVVCLKSWEFSRNGWFFVFFHEMKDFCNFLLKSFPKRRNVAICLKSWEFRPNRWLFCDFSRNEARFCSKVRQNSEAWWFVRKVSRSCQIDDFSCFLTKWGTFCKFLIKSSSKRRNVVVCSKSWEFWPNRWFFAFFHEMRHFSQLFAEKFVKASKRGD